MNDFSQFEASFVKKNRILWSALVISILLSSMTLFLVLSKERYFVLSSGEIFKERPLLEDICFESFSSMAKGNPSRHLISEGIMNILDKEPFEINVDKILKITAIGKEKCRLVIKGDGRLRSFLIGLIESEKFPFYFKLNQIDEVEVKEGI